MQLRRQIEILFPELQAYAGAICDAQHEAQDLVQDAVERAMRAKAPPRRIDELRPWMFRVLRNLRYDELRKWRVRREYSEAGRRLLDEASHESGTERVVLTRLAFAKLPSGCREVLFLVDIMGLKYREAAEVMDVPTGTVMSRLSRARKQMLDLVEGEDRESARDLSE